MRHAYLIIANQKKEQLKLLISLLDHPNNDIYLMIDKKSTWNDKDKSEFIEEATDSKVHILKSINIYWGGYELVEAELQLLKHSVSNHYDYYHLLSESDLPLASQSVIHSFFEKNNGKEFLTFSGAATQETLKERVRYHYHLPHLNYKNYPHNIGVRIFRKMDKIVQNSKDYWKDNNGDMEIGYGSQWFSITDDFARYILENEKWIFDSFSKGWLVDELFIHTLAINSIFKENIYDTNLIHDIPNEFQGNMRYINWWSGTPHTWDINSSEDIKELNLGKNLGHLFARKFDLTTDDISYIKKRVNDK